MCRDVIPVSWQEYFKKKKINPCTSNAILDGILIVVVVMVFAMISIYGSQIFDEVNQEINSSSANMSGHAVNASGQLYDKYDNLMDNLFMFMFVLFVIGVVISVFLIDTHPIFFGLTLVLLIGLFSVTLLIGNVYDDMMTDASISGYANEFPYMHWVNTHILELIVSISFLIIIAMYAKFKAG